MIGGLKHLHVTVQENFMKRINLSNERFSNPLTLIYSFLTSWCCVVVWPKLQWLLLKPLSTKSFSTGTVSNDPLKKWYSISLGLIVLSAARDSSIFPYLTGTSGLLDREYSDSITWAWSCNFSMCVIDLRCLNSGMKWKEHVCYKFSCSKNDHLHLQSPAKTTPWAFWCSKK